MDWTDDGIVLAARKHGENAVILSLLTAGHGRHAGLVRGGAGMRARGLYEPGNRVRATWRARLDEHLGAYTCELVRAAAADWFEDPLRLAGLSAACAVAEAALPEREPHAALYGRFLDFMDRLGGDDWLENYVRWERDLLTEMGFGLDLTACAANGRTDDLFYVSPRSGRAVSGEAGAPYADKMLRLPAFLLADPGNGRAAAEGAGAVLDGLALTGHFLETHAFVHDRRGMPPARARLVDRVKRLV